MLEPLVAKVSEHLIRLYSLLLESFLICFPPLDENWWLDFKQLKSLILLLLDSHCPDNRALARECRYVKIERVYIISF